MAFWLKILAAGKPFWRLPQRLLDFRIMRADSLSERPIELLRDVELRILQDFCAEHPALVPARVRRQAVACVHYRFGIDFAEHREPLASWAAAVRSMMAWPLSLPEYSRETGFMRLRLCLRAARQMLGNR